jgi:hypothetical protein
VSIERGAKAPRAVQERPWTNLYGQGAAEERMSSRVWGATSDFWALCLFFLSHFVFFSVMQGVAHAAPRASELRNALGRLESAKEPSFDRDET